jgi:hypothetical protein
MSRIRVAALALLACSCQEGRAIYEYSPVSLCVLAMNSALILEADVKSWDGSKKVRLAGVDFDGEVQLSVVHSFKGTPPKPLAAYGVGVVDEAGSSTVGPLGGNGDSPRRSILFLVGQQPPYLLCCGGQGYFYADDPAGPWRNTWRYQEGVSRVELDVAIAEYASGDRECPVSSQAIAGDGGT